MWEDILVRCDGEEPPGRLGLGVPQSFFVSEIPGLMLILGEDVKIICRLRTDMRRLPKEAFEKRKRYLGLKRFYEASYLVNMIIRPADLKFEMWYKNSRQSELLDISWEFGGNVPRGVHIDQVQTSPRSSRVNAFRWLNTHKFPEQAFAESSTYGSN